MKKFDSIRFGSVCTHIKPTFNVSNILGQDSAKPDNFRGSPDFHKILNFGQRGYKPNSYKP